MLSGSYRESIEAAHWAAARGEAIVPVLARMLAKKSAYEKSKISLGGFPFNALWALAHIRGSSSRAALEQFRARTKDPEDRKVAWLALQGHDLRRRRRSDAYAVIGETADTLRKSPSEKAAVIARLKPGLPVRILKTHIENTKEEGPRGGPTVFDYVAVLPSGRRGYVQRAGDDFTPFF